MLKDVLTIAYFKDLSIDKDYENIPLIPEMPYLHIDIHSLRKDKIAISKLIDNYKNFIPKEAILSIIEFLLEHHKEENDVKFKDIISEEVVNLIMWYCDQSNKGNI